MRRSARRSQHAHILNDMLDESSDIVGEEEVGGGRDEYSIAVGGMNAASASVAGDTYCVPKNWPYGRLDTDLSGGMAPASNQAPPLSFDRRRIVNTNAVDGFGRPGHIKELDCRL